MQPTNISWTDYTWNPTVGCPPPLASVGCEECYARKLHNMRHKAFLDGKKLPVQYAKPFEVMQLFPDRLDDPLHKRKPCRIFVDSMSDPFHKDVPFGFVDKVMAVVALCPQHTFQVLTKRVDRMKEYFGPFDIRNLTLTGSHWPYPNVHLGVSICTQAEADRIIPIHLQIPAAKRFISFEPLLEDIKISKFLLPQFEHIIGIYKNKGKEFIKPDQVIVGCESGPKRRECKLEWIINIVNQCKAAGVLVFVKQICVKGKVVRKEKGKDWPASWPKQLRLQEKI